jgi:hypothetical protein
MQKRIALVILSLAVAQLSAGKVEPKLVKKTDVVKTESVTPTNFVQKLQNGLNWTKGQAVNAYGWTAENTPLYYAQASTYVKANKKVCALATAGAVTAVVATVYLVKALRAKKQDEPVSVNV